MTYIVWKNPRFLFHNVLNPKILCLTVCSYNNMCEICHLYIKRFEKNAILYLRKVIKPKICSLREKENNLVLTVYSACCAFFDGTWPNRSTTELSAIFQILTVLTLFLLHISLKGGKNSSFWAAKFIYSSDSSY